MDMQQLLEQVLALRTPGLKWNAERKDYDEVQVAPEAFIRAGEAHIVVSADAGPQWCDYYGEFRGGHAWINPLLVEWAEKFGLYWEWENPGGIGLWPI